MVAAHRVPSYNKRRTPTIVVRFLNRDHRDTWIQGYKQKKGIRAKDVNTSFPASKLFVSEHLSPDVKRMLTKTKESCRAKGFNYEWTKEGKIVVRKRESEKCVRTDDPAQVSTL